MYTILAFLSVVGLRVKNQAKLAKLPFESMRYEGIPPLEAVPWSGLEKSSVLSVLDRFLKLKTDLFLDKKLKNRSIKLCISQYFAIYRLTLSPVKIVHT